MTYKLSEINRLALSDPKAFLAMSDERYEQQLLSGAEKIIRHASESPIVFVAGPSGSGKTTTALKLERIVREAGAGIHIVALDNYFRSVDSGTYPRTPSGEYDYESPLCLDMELLGRHFAAIERGETIELPQYLFKEQRQKLDTGRFLNAKKGDIVIFEGIHSLNDTFSSLAPNAFRVYISARSDIIDDSGNVIFKGTWMRLCRRALRDHKFRGTPAGETLRMWANVREGEKKYISPYRYKADLIFDSSLMCEVGVLKSFIPELMGDIPDHISRHEEMRLILPALDRFEAIDPALVPSDSLLREFIGGGSFKYH